MQLRQRRGLSFVCGPCVEIIWRTSLHEHHEHVAPQACASRQSFIDIHPSSRFSGGGDSLRVWRPAVLLALFLSTTRRNYNAKTPVLWFESQKQVTFRDEVLKGRPRASLVLLIDEIVNPWN